MAQQNRPRLLTIGVPWNRLLVVNLETQPANEKSKRQRHSPKSGENCVGVFFASTALESKLRTTLEIVMASIVSLLSVELNSFESGKGIVCDATDFPWLERPPL